MQLIPSLSEALDGVLCRGAFFAETHAIKGLLALDRLQRIDGFDRSGLDSITHWDQLLGVPVIDGLLSTQVSWPSEELDAGRLKGLIHGAVFPMAYLAGAEWVRRFGYEHLVEEFREVALARVGYLGHAWSIWCSFLEIAPYLETEGQRLLAAERFVEFVASQLSTPDWTSVYDIDFALEPCVLPEADVVQAVLSRPGFYGHRLISLSYLYKYRPTLSQAQWEHGLKRTFDSAQETGSTAHDILIPSPLPPFYPDEGKLKAAVLRYIGEGPKEVHTLTLADAIVELWTHLGPGERVHLFAVLQTYAGWELEHSTSGESR
jgi:hypothetical protein